MTRQRTYSIEFKRQVAQEFLGGETLHSLGKRHGISRNLIRIWVQKYEAGAFSDEEQAADLLQQYEGRIAALERLLGRLTLENELLKNRPRGLPRPICLETGGAYTDDTLDSGRLLFGGVRPRQKTWPRGSCGPSCGGTLRDPV